MINPQLHQADDETESEVVENVTETAKMDTETAQMDTDEATDDHPATEDVHQPSNNHKIMVFGENPALASLIVAAENELAKFKQIHYKKEDEGEMINQVSRRLDTIST
jgi:hypothetical protein